MHDAAGKLRLTMESAAPTWVRNEWGWALNFNVSGLAQDKTYDPAIGSTGNWTLVFGVKPVGSLSGWHSMWANAADGLYIHDSAFHAYPQTSSSASLDLDKLAVVASSHDAFSGNLIYRVHGRSKAISETFNAAGSVTLVTGARVGQDQSGEAWLGDINFILVYDRMVGEGMLRQISLDPFAMYYDE